MEIKILNSIIHKELTPWLIKTDNQIIAEKIRQVGNKEPKQIIELTRQIKILVNDFPELSKWIEKQTVSDNSDIKQLYYESSMPVFTDAISKYYSLLIRKETLRIFNVYLIKSEKWTDSIDINYHTSLLLRRIKNLTKQVFKEIADRNLQEHQAYNNINFVLQYLKHSLITLYFSVQEVHKDLLEQTITLEDFYLLELNQSLANVLEINFTGDSISKDSVVKVKKKFSFGFTGDIDKLKTVIAQLNTSIELLDENSTTTDLINTLISKSIQKKSAKIRLGCETVQFIYVINKLSYFFNNLNPKAIEESELFYSKGNTLIKAQNLYKNKIPKPKNQEIIDKIIKHLQ